MPTLTTIKQARKPKSRSEGPSRRPAAERAGQFRRIHRLLKLITLLQSGRGCDTPAVLRKRIGKTAERMVNMYKRKPK